MNAKKPAWFGWYLFLLGGIPPALFWHLSNADHHHFFHNALGEHSHFHAERLTHLEKECFPEPAHPAEDHDTGPGLLKDLLKWWFLNKTEYAAPQAPPIIVSLEWSSALPAGRFLFGPSRPRPPPV